MQFDTLLAASSNPYVVFAPDDTIVWANAAYLETTMRRLEDIVGRKWFDAFPVPGDSEGFQLLAGSLARVRATGVPDALALLRYPLVNPDGTETVRYWSCVHTPLLDAAGRVTAILVNPIDVTELQNLRTLRDEAGVVKRARLAEQRNRDITQQLEQSRSIVEQAPGIVAVLIGRQHRFEVANAACREFWGRGELVGRQVAEVLPETVEQQFIAMLDNVLSTGEAFVGKGVPVRRFRSVAGGDEERYVDCVFQPIVEPDGAVIGIYAQGYDVTDQVKADEQQELLVNELNHRVKNTLSIIQGLAFQSFGKLANDGPYKGFKRRLDALAAAHSLLTDAKWERASLLQTVRMALQAATGADAERCTVEGDDAELSPQAAVSLSMIIHELSTNAIKYGALSQPGGQVAVQLGISSEDEGRLMTLVWRERNGPPVELPKRRGFGTRLIGRGLANHPKARAELDFAAEGLVCTIVAGVR